MRVNLCRAFYGNPELILLDEPFEQLNEQLVHKITTSIKRYNSKLIIASNNPLMLQVADKIIKMGKGVVLEEAQRDFQQQTQNYTNQSTEWEFFETKT